jgi:hypothetical protein
MSSIYGEVHRGLQDKFETRRLADRLEAMIVKDFMDEQDQGFASTRDMFFLSTVDQYGRPTVSYNPIKGVIPASSKSSMTGR